MRLLRRIRYLLRFRREAAELAEELDQHRALAERGASMEEARRRMGNTALASEQARQVWVASWVESVAQDVRYAARSLRAQPGFTAMALLALISGIGLNTSLFTAINSILTEPWNVPEPERVVTLFPITARGPVNGFALTAARFLNENSRTIEGAVAMRSFPLELDGTAGGPGANTAFVTGNFFDVMQVRMTAGRPFTPQDDSFGSPGTVAVISHALWAERYQSNPEILGRNIRLDGTPFTVIGVAAEPFGGVTEDRTDVWVPYASLRVVRRDDPSAVTLLTDPGRCCSEVAARLRPGIARGQAQAELDALYQQYLAEVNRVPAEGFLLSRAPAHISLAGTAVLDNPEVRRRAGPVVLVLLGAFGSILLLACANVSNLLLARAAARQREVAVRVAIGAGRWRVIRQLLTESLLLGGIASAGGLALAYVLPDLVVRLAGQTRPENLSLTPDGNVLAYAVAIAVVSALVVGLAPALRGTRISVSEAMKRHSAHASPRIPLRGVLMAVQVTVSVALLMGASLLVRGLVHARSVDPEFQTEGITAVRITLPAGVDAAGRRTFFDGLLARMGSAGLSVLTPLDRRREYMGSGTRCAQGGFVTGQWVSSGYFDVLGIPVLAGRTFAASDQGRASILVNETFARMCWPDRSPVGEPVDRGVAGEIIGVVRDAQIAGIGPVPPTFFTQYEGQNAPVLLLPSRRAAAAVAAVREMNPGAAAETFGLREQAERSLGVTAGVARMAGALGLLALFLATVGLYGVISYSVEQRRREIGVRMALGARPREVAGLVLRKNARAVLIGLAAGLALGGGASVVLESQLYGLSPLDPLAYAGVLLILLVAGTAASLIPARRAAGIDPVSTLRQD